MDPPPLQDNLFALPQITTTSDDYYTPAWIFDRLGLRFDLDPCSPPGGPHHVPADRYYTQEDNGLTAPWSGLVWMNPPFSKATPWVTRWTHHAEGVALLPLAKSLWFNNLWDNPAVSLTILPPSLKFISAANNGSVFTPCCLAAMGRQAVAAIGNFGNVR